MQNLPASARVEIGLHVNVEKPFGATEQRLASAADTTVDADHPEQDVEGYEGQIVYVQVTYFVRPHKCY
jgi:hypothetical protein